MKRLVKLTIALFALAGAHPAAAQPSDPIDVLLVQDVRLARIADRIMGANRELCRRIMPGAGFVIHSRDQYSASVAGQRFANGPVAVAAVLAESPAAAADLRADDGIVAIGDKRISDLRAEGDAPLRDAAFAVLADQAADAPLTLTILRDGAERTVTLPPRPQCRALVEIKAGQALAARTDGRVVQINYGLAASATDDELAVIFAHELAHVVLEHRRRLEAAGVMKGFFGEFGRNQQLNRQVEVEADRLSVHLLANAGIDPATAPTFWRSRLGRRAGHAILRSAVYPSPEGRAQLLDREIADYLGGGAGPTWPGHLLSRRDVPF